MTPPSLPRSRKLLEAGIEDGLHLGAQLVVSRDGERAEIVVGEARLGHPLRAETPMLWLSSTKPVAAVALGQLWERGHLELDDPIARHVPEFGAHDKGGITLRHALTHTAGFRILRTGFPEKPWDEIVAGLSAARPEPRSAPGERAGYHLASTWFLLGEVVRRVDGRHFSSYVRDEVFQPLGMTSSWIGMPEATYAERADELAVMYDTSKSPAEALPLHERPWVVGCSPGGNGWGPMGELVAFYEMLLGRGTHRGSRILSPQTVEALTTPQRVGMMDRTFKYPLTWGLGFIVNAPCPSASGPMPYGYGPHASRRTFGHGGSESSAGWADPEHGLAVAFATNGRPGAEAHQERVEALGAAVYEDLGLAA